MKNTQSMTYQQGERIEMLLKLQAIQLNNVFTILVSLMALVTPEKDLPGLKKILDGQTAENRKLVTDSIERLSALGAAERQTLKRVQDAQASNIEEALRQEMSKPPVGFKPRTS